jgi:hypothetical protein
MNWFLPRLPKRQPSKILRRVLARLGPSWSASPLRRATQVICLLLFLTLFFYVCWPYTARPSRTWSGWLPVEVDAAAGEVTAALEQPLDEPIAPGAILHVLDQGSERAYLGPVRVAASSAK